MKNSRTIKTVIFVIEIIGMIIVAILFARWDEVSISKGIAAMSVDISILIITSQFIESLSTYEADESHKQNHKEIISKIDNLENSIDIETVYKKIHMIENTEQKVIYLKSIDIFLDTMNNRIKGSRSGALSRLDYYSELTKAADKIICDYKANPKDFKGEIWAMTFWQDDELDLSDENESAWVRKMEKIDELGIKTRRLCVMKNKKSILKRENIDDEICEFLKKVHYYCNKNIICKNTTVYAIDNIDSLSIMEQEWIGKGFFAIKLSNDKLRLIRGVSLDNRNASTLGGEIDFDDDRVRKIRTIWEKLIEQSAGRTMTEYLVQTSSKEVKNKMKEMNFNI